MTFKIIASLMTSINWSISTLGTYFYEVKSIRVEYSFVHLVAYNNVTKDECGNSSGIL